MSANATGIINNDSSGAKQVTAELIISELNFLFQMSFLYRGLRHPNELELSKKKIPLSSIANTTALEAKIKTFSEQTLPYFESFCQNFPDIENEFGIMDLIKIIKRNLETPAENEGIVETPDRYFENFILIGKDWQELSSSAGCAAIAKHITYSEELYSLFNSTAFKQTFLDLAYEAEVIKTTVERLTEKNDIKFHGRPVLDFLVLPFQRVCKYPLLAKDVIKKLTEIKLRSDMTETQLLAIMDGEGKRTRPKSVVPEFIETFKNNMSAMVNSYSDKIDVYLQVHSILNKYLDTEFFDFLKIDNDFKTDNPNLGTDIIMPCLVEIKKRKQSVPSKVKKELSAYMQRNLIKPNLDLRIALETNFFTRIKLKTKRFFSKPEKNIPEPPTDQKNITDTTSTEITRNTESAITNTESVKTDSLTSAPSPANTVLFPHNNTEPVTRKPPPTPKQVALSRVLDKIDFMVDVFDKRNKSDSNIFQSKTIKELDSLGVKLSNDRTISAKDIIKIFEQIDEIYSKYIFVPTPGPEKGHLGDIKQGYNAVKEFLAQEHIKKLLPAETSRHSKMTKGSGAT